MRRPVAAGLALLVLTVSAPHPIRAALPPAPFVLSAWPGTVEEGGELTLQLRARDGAGRADTLVDLYVAVIQDGKFFGTYLTDRQAWSSTPEPYRRRIALEQVDGLTVRFQGVNPAGWFTFRVYFVRTTAETLSRKHYALQPVDVNVRIEPAGESERRGLSLLSVGLLTVAAWMVVFRYPRRRPPPVVSAPTAT